MAVTFGTEYNFQSLYTQSPHCTVLDSTHIAVVYSNNVNYDGFVKIGTISNDDEITWGDEYTFWDSSEESGYQASSIKVKKLTSTTFVIAWNAPNGSHAVIGTVSNGDEVSLGTTASDNTKNFQELDLTVLSTTSFVIAGKDVFNSNYGTAAICTISGTTITFGANKYVFNSADTDYTSISALDSTHFSVSYKDDGGDDYGCSKIGVISSSTVITFGDEYVFNSADSRYIDNCAIDSTHFVVSYRDDGNSRYGTVIIGTVSNDDDISFGSEAVFNSNTTNYTSIRCLDSTHFVVSYQDIGNSNYGTSKTGIISGSSISFESSSVFNEASAYDISSCIISSSSFVVVFRDGGNSNYGKAVIGLYTADPEATTENSIFFGMNF